MKNSHIEWTDHTFNPWEGCTKVSPGCAHCYAEARNQRFSAGANWGKGAPRRRTSAQNWKQPMKWNAGAGDLEYESAMDGLKPRRQRVFCASLADWLDDEVPVEWLADLLRLIARTPNLDWQLLTKRPQNWGARMHAVCDVDGDSIAWSWLRGNAPANIWLGATVEDQPCADARIPKLLKIPALVRFLSCEPLLGPVDLTCDGLVCTECPHCIDKPADPDTGSWEACQRCDFTGKSEEWAIDWVICGGESGLGARPMHPDWARSLRDQCAAAGVPFLFKQWGEWVKYIDRDKEDPDWVQKYTVMRDSKTFEFLNLKGGCGFHGERFHVMQRVGKIHAGRQLDGDEHNEFPSSASSVSSP